MTSSPVDSDSARWPKWVAIGLGGLLLGCVVGWAAAIVLTAPQDVLDSQAFTYVEVTGGEVGSSITLNTAAVWAPVPAGTNLASGTVTTVETDAGREVDQGSILYTVDLRPVVVAQGPIPTFDAMAGGAVGAHVGQLQAMLIDLGFYKGAVDGKFERGTESAVRAWQESLGVAQDGVVQRGDIIFVPTLPARVTMDSSIVKRGAQVAGGEEVLQALPATPEFTIGVTTDQAALMPVGTAVEITSPAGEIWSSVVAAQQSNDQEGFTLILGAENEGAICADSCRSIPVEGQTLLTSEVVTVETVEGLTVPSAALVSQPDGILVLIDESGVEHPVTVLASAKGISVVEGVSAGTRARLPDFEE
jgi:peptidoglycan hydrolase-like protein with peptidoglycan-binding domain